ncbi:MAG: hypothetical protein HYY58_00110 [Candidatus Omnitrophica bacterium]|nr:hypothetical protein [Candidatus Omnitrophota bacterium]
MSQTNRRRSFRGLCVCLITAGFIGLFPSLLRGAGTTWSFEADDVGQSPKEFVFGTTGSGQPGQWIVKSESDAPSGAHVLAQVSTDRTDYRFPVAVALTPLVRDASVSVRCEMVSGEVDQACGLVVRYQDERNYYITRANALEQNVRFYKVVDGSRQQLASWKGAVTRGVWQELMLHVQGDQFTVVWNGQPILEATDQTFQDAGHVGVWTKADSVTYYDDLRVKFVEP